VYESGAQTLLHLDLYRLKDASELDYLGLTEWARPGCLWLIEWPQRGGELLPPADLLVTLAAGPDGHEASLAARTAAGAAWLARMHRNARS
jgi:tRNA threonylcarbamoyladenosine biosynthesis protein TsaE